MRWRFIHHSCNGTSSGLPQSVEASFNFIYRDANYSGYIRRKYSGYALHSNTKVMTGGYVHPQLRTESTKKQFIPFFQEGNIKKLPLV